MLSYIGEQIRSKAPGDHDMGMGLLYATNNALFGIPDAVLDSNSITMMLQTQLRTYLNRKHGNDAPSSIISIEFQQPAPTYGTNVNTSY